MAELDLRTMLACMAVFFFAVPIIWMIAIHVGWLSVPHE